MTLKEIYDQCKTLQVFEERRMTDDYCEVVFYNKEADKLNATLALILGVACKPAGKKPNKDDARLTEPFGGVWGDQVLYKKAIGDELFLVMLWPWQDETHTTVKMARIKAG